MTDDHLRTFVLLVAAIHAYNRVYTNQTCPNCGATWEGDPECWWCNETRQAQHDHTLQPPAERGYGYAARGDRCDRHDRWWVDGNNHPRCCNGPFTRFDDFKTLGYDPDLERHQDLERWRQHMQIAADAGLITETEGNTAWRSATNPTSSTSSTGTNSTPTKTTKNQRSFPDSASAAAGQRSTPARKPGNRRSS